MPPLPFHAFAQGWQKKLEKDKAISDFRAFARGPVAQRLRGRIFPASHPDAPHNYLPLRFADPPLETGQTGPVTAAAFPAIS